MRRAGTTLLAVVSIVASACGSDSAGSSSPGSSSPDGEIDGTVLVAAAASLTDAFDEIAERFEATYPGVDVEVSFGGSSSLAVAIEEGSPFDVFASANEDVMLRLAEGGSIDGDPIVFATNALALAVPTGQRRVTSLDDFSRSDLFLGACAAQVPCGDYADRLFDAAGVEPSLDTREADVRSLVTKLVEGELDAGIVYRSDVSAFPDDLEAIPLPDGIEILARYPIAVVADAPNAVAARAFVEFTTGSEARGVLEQSGFDTP